MERLAARACPICCETRVEVLRTFRFVLPEGHPLSDGYDVVCCQCCGLVFADTTVTQQDYVAFYASFSIYEDGKTGAGSGDVPWDAQRLEQTAAELARFLPNKQTRLLDIGCANGGLLDVFKQRGYTNLYGFDPSPTCVANTRNRRGIEAFVGSLSSVPDHLGRFDCVILSHVMEHVYDLQQAVQCIGKLTQPNGVIYIEVPDASRYAEFVVAPFQDFNTEHINHFSLRCLTNLFRPAGWLSRVQGQKIVYAAPDKPYPAVYALYTRSPHGSTFVIERDHDLCEGIKHYIIRSQKIMDTIEAKLRQVIETNSEVIVWGTGQLTMKLLAETSLGQARIAAFVDSNPINQGKCLRGRPILAPAQIKELYCPIIVASLLHSAEIADVIRNQMELPNPIILL